jgi:3-deoxy-manno-octulosonate cytidylyltransferase (CMP-KDO synthetase)
MPAPPAFRVVIPARHDSTRLPGKVLLPLNGKPLLQWVHERACAAGASEVLIAADDERIVSAARAFGATVLLTQRTHASGTDRIAEVARARQWPADSLVVNLQGDEPLMPASLLAQVVAQLQAHGAADIATLATPIESLTELLDPNVVKVVTDLAGMALYFSRAPIPFERSGTAAAPGGFAGTQRHRGLYAYRVAALLRLAQLPVSPLEAREKLEQLRALENGLQIHVATARERPGPDVNTAADLAQVAALLRA